MMNPNLVIVVCYTGAHDNAKLYQNTGHRLVTDFSQLNSDNKSKIVIFPELLELYGKEKVRIGLHIASIAQQGIQIVLRTQDDCIFGGIRLAVSKGIISHDNIKILYFDGDVKKPTCNELHINKYGAIPDWPNSMFHEMLDVSGEIMRNSIQIRKEEECSK